MKRALDVEATTVFSVPEVDQDFPAYSLPPDEMRVAGDITLGMLLENQALQMVHQLTAMGDTRHGNEYTNR